MRMFMACVVFIFGFMKTASTADLQQQKQHEYLNPVNDHQQKQVAKEQDKRTVFSNHAGWAKHVGVHPSGFKYIIGYGPVDLKYVPVVKPISIRPLPHHHHHKVRLHLKHPLVVRPFVPVRPIIHHDGWRPVVPVVRPAVPVRPLIPVPVNVPAPPHISHRPWQQEGWIGAEPVHVHPVQPVHTVVKPVQPVVPIQPVVHPVHVKPVVQVVPAKPFIPVPQPATPIVPIAQPVHQLVHQGFGTTVIHPAGVPLHTHLHSPGLLHHHHHLVPGNQVPIAAPPPQFVIPQAPPAVPAVPQHVPVHFHPTHFHPYVPEVPHTHPQLPEPPHEQHDVQTPLIPHDHSIFIQQVPHQHPHIYQQVPQEPHLHAQHPGIYQPVPQEPHLHAQHPGIYQPVPQEPHLHVQHPEIYHQQLPHEHVPVQNPEIFHQQLPHDPNAIYPQHPEQLPVDQQLPQNPPVIFHQQSPGNVRHHFNQQIQHGEGATSNILLQGSIQPGHTDVQIPVHLPQHPNYLPEEGRQFYPGNFHDPSQHPDVVRPAIALEPPFNHKK